MKKLNKYKNALYTSFQMYSVELARLLESEYGWQPVYWLTQKTIKSAVIESFPNAVCHHYIDSVKGVPPDELRQLELELLEPELLDKLSKYEYIALSMMERNDSNSDSFRYRDRLEFYYYLIRYWKTVIKQRNIDLVVFEEEPHQASDYVLYILCDHYNIETIVTVRTISDLGIIPMRRFEIGSEIIIGEYNRRLNQYKEGDEVILPKNIQSYFDKLNSSYDRVLEDHLWDQVERVRAMSGSSNLTRMVMGVAKTVSDKVFNLSQQKERLEYIVKGEFDSDQKEKNKSIYDSHQSYLKMLRYKAYTIARKYKNKKYYNKVASDDLDIDCAYVFCALQYQPEKTTCPLGERFTDQYLMIEMLSKMLPPGWKLYVKEHPSQFVYDYTRYGDNFRSKSYYDRVRELPNVYWVPLHMDVFKLIDGSKTVASIGGTICWEAVVRGIPALTFGYAWYKACEGVINVKTAADLKTGLDRVRSGFVVNRDKVKLFAEVLSGFGFSGVIGGEFQLVHKNLTPTENAQYHFKAISNMLSYEASVK